MELQSPTIKEHLLVQDSLLIAPRLKKAATCHEVGGARIFESMPGLLGVFKMGSSTMKTGVED